MKSNSFVGACKDFFGFRPGEGLKAFGDELKALSEHDRNEIRDGLIANGYNIVETPVMAQAA